MARRRKRGFTPWRDQGGALERALAAREEGATLRQGAAAAGVHVATLCRWQARDGLLREALTDAEWVARRRRFDSRPTRRPRVPWHPACPWCGARAEQCGIWGGWPYF